MADLHVISEPAQPLHEAVGHARAVTIGRRRALGANTPQYRWRRGGKGAEATAQFEHVVAAYSDTAYAGSEDPAWENPYTKPIDQLLGAVTKQYLAMGHRNSPSGATRALLVPR